MVPDRENLELTLRIIGNDVLASSDEDDETLIQKNSGNIITKKCVIYPDDIAEGFINKHGLDGFYLRLRILECEIVEMYRYIVLSGKDNIMKLTDICGPKKIEIVAKPIPPGIMKKDATTDIDASVIKLGEHFLHKPSALGWVKRYLALGRICSYPFSFSKTSAIEEEMTPILYLFDQEDLFEPISAFRLDHIEDVSIEHGVVGTEYNLCEDGTQNYNDNIFYHWSLKLYNIKQTGSTKLNLKSSRLDHINRTISAILLLRQESSQKSDNTKPLTSKATKANNTISPELDTSILQVTEQNIPPILEVFHWYIEEVINIMTSDENSQYISTRGIFRVGGRLNIIEQLYEKIRSPTTIPGDSSILSQLNQLEVHDLAGLLKKLVREYPGKLIPCNISKWLISPLTKYTNNIPPLDRIMEIFGPVLGNDKTNDFEYTEEDRYRLELLIKLMQFLKRVSECSIDRDNNGSKDSDDVGNMMDTHNLAIIFAPNLFDFQNLDQPHTTKKKNNVQAGQIHVILKYMTSMIQYLMDHISDLCV